MKRRAEDLSGSLPLLELWRPQTLDEILGHEKTIQLLKKLSDRGQLPHLMFYGPPGTGKTTTVLAIARRLYGDKMKRMVLELNASDERGIDVVRDQIKNFVQTSALLSLGMDSTMPKLVILDEADQMTNAAQSSLRRVVEQYTDNARFCFICNYQERIIQAIRSRCTRFRFSPLKDEHVATRVRFVAEQEDIKVTDAAVEALVSCAKGDLRKGLNYLQASSVGKQATVQPKNVYRACGRAEPTSLRELGRTMLNSTVREGRLAIARFVEEHCCSIYDLIDMMHAQLEHLKIPEKVYVEVLLPDLGDVQFRAAKGIPEKKMAMALAAVFAKTAAAMKK